MSFDWSQYLTLAQELTVRSRGTRNREARLRSAISRAYYAAFIQSRNHLRDKEGHSIPSDQDAHRYVRNEFRKSPDPARRELARELSRLRGYRNNADYDNVFTDLPIITRQALSKARYIISILNRL